MASTRSFTLQSAKVLGPEPSLVPLFVEALKKGQRGGSDPEDVFYSTLHDENPELVEKILKGWKKAPKRQTARRSLAFAPRMEEASWADRVTAKAVEYSTYHDTVRQMKRRLIKNEIDRALEGGITNWVPSDEVRANKSLLYEASRAVWAEVTTDCCRGGSADEVPAPPKPTYGLRLSQITCHEKDEIGHDEVYVVSVAVDNAGNLKAVTTPKYSMNDSDKSVKWPNQYLYPPGDPKGFLDLAVVLWEDDGGYTETAKAVAALGASIAAAGVATVNPLLIKAGVALGVIGGLIGLAGLFDKDDRYGGDSLVWASNVDLESGVGPYPLSFVNLDTGLTDFTSYNYDLQIDLIAPS